MLNFHIMFPHFIFLCYVCRCRFCFHWKFVRRGCKAQYFFHLHTHERELLCLAKWAISVTHQISELKVVIPENLTIFSFSSIHCNITSSDTDCRYSLDGCLFFSMVTLFQAPTWAKSAGFQKSLPSDGQLFSGKYHPFLYNKLSCARILIGSHLWSIGGQTYRWRHQWHTRLRLVCHFFVLTVVLTSSVIYYWTDARQLGIYLLNIYLEVPHTLFWLKIEI